MSKRLGRKWLYAVRGGGRVLVFLKSMEGGAGGGGGGATPRFAYATPPCRLSCEGWPGGLAYRNPPP